MNKQSLLWNEIKEKYPHQNVGLINVKYFNSSKIIESAVVYCSDKDTSYDDMCLLAAKGDIVLRYTTLDEDFPIT